MGTLHFTLFDRAQYCASFIQPPCPYSTYISLHVHSDIIFVVDSQIPRRSRDVPFLPRQLCQFFLSLTILLQLIEFDVFIIPVQPVLPRLYQLIPLLSTAERYISPQTSPTV